MRVHLELRLAFLFPLLLLSAACRTDRASAPPNLDDAVVTALAADDAWVVEEGGRAIGSVVRYEESESGSRTLFVVRNEHGQDVGTIDGKGRAYRLRPHREPEWVGTGTVLEAVRMVLGRGNEARLRQVSVEELRGEPAGS